MALAGSLDRSDLGRFESSRGRETLRIFLSSPLLRPPPAEKLQWEETIDPWTVTLWDGWMDRWAYGVRRSSSKNPLPPLGVIELNSRLQGVKGRLQPGRVKMHLSLTFFDISLNRCHPRDLLPSGAGEGESSGQMVSTPSNRNSPRHTAAAG